MISIYQGAPQDISARAENEQAVYRFLTELGVPFARADHPAANTMADCLAFLAEHPGSSVRVLTTGATEEHELVSQALAGQDYVDAGTGPIGCTIATHVGVHAIAISYCPRYQPIH